MSFKNFVCEILGLPSVEDYDSLYEENVILKNQVEHYKRWWKDLKEKEEKQRRKIEPNIFKVYNKFLVKVRANGVLYQEGFDTIEEAREFLKEKIQERMSQK